MIQPDNYIYFYLLIIAVVSSFVISNYYGYSDERFFTAADNSGGTSILVFVILMAVFVGLRPLSVVFADMSGYYYDVEYNRFGDRALSEFDHDWVYIILVKWLSFLHVSGTMGIVIFDLINFIFTYIAVRKLFPKDALLAMLVFFASFSTFSYATNGIRSGMAAAICLCAIAYKESYLKSALFLLLSFGMHHSEMIILVSFILCSICDNSKLFLLCWIVSMIVAILHITYFQQFFANFTDPHASLYLLNAQSVRDLQGFQLKFVLYSAFPVFIGFYAMQYSNVSSFFKFILNLYLVANSIWMLCMYSNDNNRIAYLSWSIWPIVILYPYLQERYVQNRYSKAALIAIINLAFVLFMEILYYPLLHESNYIR